MQQQRPPYNVPPAYNYPPNYQTYGQPQQPQPYTQQQQQQQQQQPNFTQQIMMDPNTISLVGNQAFQMGQQYVSSHSSYFQWSSWKLYWNVDHQYVLRKLLLVLYPFRVKVWSRQRLPDGQFKHPRHDLHAPDLYVPIMAFVTYCLLIATVMGTQNKFRPEVLTMIASSAMVVSALEVFYMWLGIYLLNITQHIPITDLLAYCGYKFVTVLFVQSLALTGLWFVKWPVLLYGVIALGLFVVRSMRQVILPQANETPDQVLNTQTQHLPNAVERKRRVYFLFTFSVLQACSVWWLVR